MSDSSEPPKPGKPKGTLADALRALDAGDGLVSRAPPPETPLRGTSYRFPDAIPSPDWDFWRKMENVKIWDAVALSCDMEPRSRGSVDVIADYFNGDRGNSKEYRFFADKMRIVQASDKYRGVEVASLGEFVSWAGEKRFDSLPPSFTAMAMESAAEKAKAPRSRLIETAQKGLVSGGSPDAPWELIDPQDPDPAQPWYTPARYFARLLVRDDPSLLGKKKLLRTQISARLADVGVYKRGGNKPLDPETIRKALNKIDLG